MELKKEIHPFEPVADKNSRLLILGSFPSVKSRENKFYYGHPKNRFWPMLAHILGCAVPVTTEEKKNMVLSHKIALWDTLASCEIHASSDASIKSAVPNDIPMLVGKYGIRAVICNGKTSFKYYEKYFKKDERMAGISVAALPSTSPANAAVSMEMLVKAWGEAIELYMNGGAE